MADGDDHVVAVGVDEAAIDEAVVVDFAIDVVRVDEFVVRAIRDDANRIMVECKAGRVNTPRLLRWKFLAGGGNENAADAPTSPPRQ